MLLARYWVLQKFSWFQRWFSAMLWFKNVLDRSKDFQAEILFVLKIFKKTTVRSSLNISNFFRFIFDL